MTVCKTGAGNSLDETGRVPRGPGNSTGEPGNRPEDVGNVPRGISHNRECVKKRAKHDRVTAHRRSATRGRTWATCRGRPPTAAVDVGNNAAATSHRSDA